MEAAGDVDVLLLDKTGTITLGNRQADDFLPLPGVAEKDLADVAQLASLADETPEGRSIVVLAKENASASAAGTWDALGAVFVPFTAQTRLSGVDLPGRAIRKGAADAVKRFVTELGGRVPREVDEQVRAIAESGGTPLLVAENDRVLGAIWLKDIVKGGIRERFAQLRGMGIKTVMVTGDNPLTAAAIAAEAGVDDFLAEATPETKLALIRKTQAEGRLVAMTGDGTNDAPALAQADVGRGHELRHPGRQGGREHGGPGFQPHQAPGSGGDRQATAHDARVADHLFPSPTTSPSISPSSRRPSWASIPSSRRSTSWAWPRRPRPFSRRSSSMP